MTTLSNALLCTMIFLCTYVIVDRICKCVETCAISKSYSESMKATNKYTRFGLEEWRHKVLQGDGKEWGGQK